MYLEHKAGIIPSADLTDNREDDRCFQGNLTSAPSAIFSPRINFSRRTERGRDRDREKEGERERAREKRRHRERNRDKRRAFNREGSREALSKVGPDAVSRSFPREETRTTRRDTRVHGALDRQPRLTMSHVRAVTHGCTLLYTAGSKNRRR